LIPAWQSAGVAGGSTLSHQDKIMSTVAFDLLVKGMVWVFEIF